MFLLLSGVSKDSGGREPVRFVVSRQYQTKKKKNIATCILVHSGLIKILKQLAYKWKETGCSRDVNIARIVLMTYWSHY